MNCSIRNSPSDEASEGSIYTQYVFTMPSAFRIIYCGIARTTGTITNRKNRIINGMASK